MSTDTRPLRWLTNAAVLLVAAIAATISYMHIANLALDNGQPALAAYLLPISVDGVVATSSLVMLRAARGGADSPGIARAGLAMSITATLGANVMAGLGHGWLGALLSGLPALGFVVSTETAIAMAKRAHVQVAAETASHNSAESVAAGIATLVTAPAATTSKPARHGAKRGRSRRGGSPEARQAEHAKLLALAQAELARELSLSGAELGRRLGVSPDTGRRLMTEIRAAQSQIPEAATVP